MEPLQTHILSEDMSGDVFWYVSHEKYRGHDKCQFRKFCYFQYWESQLEGE